MKLDIIPFVRPAKRRAAYVADTYADAWPTIERVTAFGTRSISASLADPVLEDIRREAETVFPPTR